MENVLIYLWQLFCVDIYVADPIITFFTLVTSQLNDSCSIDLTDMTLADEDRILSAK